MKFIVDELPKHPGECYFHYMKYNLHNTIGVLYDPVHRCRITDDLNFTCSIGKDWFECPYLKKFEAEAEEAVPEAGPGIVKLIQVRLKGR